MKLEETAFESPVHRSQDDFVEVLRGLVHELSQPLTSLGGSLEVALMGETDENEYRSVLRQSLKETHRLTEVLTTLREALEAENSGEDFHPVCWKHLVTRVLEDVTPLAQRKGLRFIQEPMVDAYVKVNPLRIDAAMRKLFWQLINQGGRKAVFHVGLAVQGDTASLSVYDDSLLQKTAVPAEKPHLPASFTQVSERTQPEWWIVQRIIEGQGGWLEIEKVPPRRICYRVHLPLASLEAATPPCA